MPTKPLVDLTGAIAERSRYSSDFALSSLTTITICSDYICPWCYVAFFQARKLTEKYGVNFDWRGCELYPPGMVVPTKPVAPPPDPNTPPPPPAPPSRFDLFLEEEELTLPSPRPSFKRSHNALMAAEYATVELGPLAFDAFNEAVFRGYWEQGKDISKLDVLQTLADGAGLDGEALVRSVASNRYERHIIPFDDESYALGIRNVPTFIFGGNERLAEANYTDLARATERFLLRSAKFKGK